MFYGTPTTTVLIFLCLFYIMLSYTLLHIVHLDKTLQSEYHDACLQNHNQNTLLIPSGKCGSVTVVP